jgi:hypothetical protein
MSVWAVHFWSAVYLGEVAKKVALCREFHFDGGVGKSLAMRAVWCALALVLAGCSAAPHTSLGVPRSSAPVRTGPEPPTSAEAARVIGFAAAQIGKKYCWGGIGPECFDCSGLVQQAWRAVGIRLPRTATAMASVEPEVPIAEVQVGDILWWPGHVGIYAGAGWLIDAYDSRHGVVRRRPVVSAKRAFRPLSSSQPASLTQSSDKRVGGDIDRFDVEIDGSVRTTRADSIVGTVLEAHHEQALPF